MGKKNKKGIRLNVLFRCRCVARERSVRELTDSKDITNHHKYGDNKHAIPEERSIHPAETQRPSRPRGPLSWEAIQMVDNQGRKMKRTEPPNTAEGRTREESNKKKCCCDKQTEPENCAQFD